MIKPGLIGIVGEESKKDFWATMQKVAEIGYQGIEGGEGELMKGDPKENLKRFHGLGLKVLTVTGMREQLRDNLDGVIRTACALQAPRVTCWWGPAESKEQVLKDAELYNAAGAKLAAEGLRLCYHNHDHEFKKSFNGVYALDVLAEHTDPKNLAFNIDIMWVTFGGEDPVRVLRRLAGRVPAIHVKDTPAVGTPKAAFTAVGTGVVRTREAVLAADEIGVEWAIVEQDQLRNLSAMDTARFSYQFLKESGLI
jgi:sugar phosphate isomerase/epimerase